MINASLGAHYSGKFVFQSFTQLLKQIFLIPQKDFRPRLKEKLAELLKSDKHNIQLVYKGRDAIELTLQRYGITDPKDVVITQAFTCSAIEEGISRAGATAIYTDIGKNQLNLTVASLEKTWTNNHSKYKIKAILVQHSLGHPAEIKNIAAWCKKKDIILIEDLAQSFGATDKNKKPLGTYADAIILSFGRDKVIDAITGGAVIFKTHFNSLLNKSLIKKDDTNKEKKKVKKVYHKGIHEINSKGREASLGCCEAREGALGYIKLKTPTQKIILKDLSYPVITWLIRKTFLILVPFITKKISLGKIIHLFFKKINLLNSPTFAPTKSITSMPSVIATLVISQLEDYGEIKKHRQKITRFYLKNLEHLPIKFFTKHNHLETASLLRFALLVPKWKELLESWKKNNIHLDDRWYRQAVDCGSKNCSLQYKPKSCPNAEKTSNQIINLPTHSQISLKDADKIVSHIKNLYSK